MRAHDQGVAEWRERRTLDPNAGQTAGLIPIAAASSIVSPSCAVAEMLSRARRAGYQRAKPPAQR